MEKIIETTIDRSSREDKNYEYCEWFFIAENELRNETKNFDIDVNYTDDADMIDDVDVIDTSEYVLAVGGGEHYVIFKNNDMFNKNKSDFLCGKSFTYINVDEPIYLSESIAFVIEFED